MSEEAEEAALDLEDTADGLEADGTPAVAAELRKHASLIRSQAERIKELEADYEEAIAEAREEGIDEGRTEAQGATDEFWRMMQSYLLKEGIEPTPESGEGITAQEMMDAVHELIRCVRQEAARAAMEPRNG